MNIKNVNCASIRKHLCSELDEGINSARCRALQKHLKNCLECATYLGELKKTIRLYRRYPEIKISRNSENRLLRSVFASGPAKRSGTERIKRK